MTSHHAPPAGTMSREQISENLAYAEGLFADPDPYRRQHGYETARRAYEALAYHQEDPMLAMACRQAAARYHARGAFVRFEHGIPTIFPRTEAAALGLEGCCQACGRPWSLRIEGACPQCPRLTFGPTPTSREDAAHYPSPTAVDPSRWSTAEGHDD